MKLVPLEEFPRLNVTPLARTCVEDSRVSIEVDSEREERLRLVFSPFQSVRVTTADCFLVSGGMQVVPGRIYEIADSTWIESLRSALNQIDSTATFLDRARHFLVPAQDEFIEVVAWSMQCEKI